MPMMMHVEMAFLFRELLKDYSHLESIRIEHNEKKTHLLILKVKSIDKSLSKSGSKFNILEQQNYN